MNDPSPAPLFAQRDAIRFGAVLLACTGAIVAFSIADGARTRERFSQTTAVEDHQFYVPPNPPLAVPEPAVTWQGRRLAPVNYEKEPLRDAQLTRLGIDETSGLGIYSLPSRPGPLFIKIGPNAYLRLNTP
jgi:hypothetical protein